MRKELIFLIHLETKSKQGPFLPVEFSQTGDQFFFIVELKPAKNVNLPTFDYKRPKVHVAWDLVIFRKVREKRSFLTEDQSTPAFLLNSSEHYDLISERGSS